MTDTDTRGLLRTIKVPFDIKAIFLGAIGYLVFIAGGWLLDWVYKDVGNWSVVSTFICQGLSECSIALRDIPVIGREIQELVTVLYGQAGPPEALNWYEMLFAGVWFIAVLSIFGGAIARVIAMRIARDESVSMVDALKFSATNILSYLLVPVFLGVAIAFFYGCNALAGLTYSIPGLGPFLLIVLYPLVILSSLIILLIALGGLLGLFMMVSAVSTEKNGTLDAISRAFSYIYSRPLQFFFYYFLIFLMASLIALIALNIFPGMIESSMSEGIANDKHDLAFQIGMADAKAAQLPTLKEAPFFPAIGIIVTWFFSFILLLGIKGFILAYVMGGTTAVYFTLRGDVDGTEDSEIYIEGSEDDDFYDFDRPAAPEKVDEPAKEEPAEEEAPEEEKAAEEEAPAEEEAAEEETPEEEEAPEEETPAEEEAEEEAADEEGGEEEEEKKEE